MQEGDNYSTSPHYCSSRVSYFAEIFDRSRVVETLKILGSILLKAANISSDIPLKRKSAYVLKQYKYMKSKKVALLTGGTTNCRVLES